MPNLVNSANLQKYIKPDMRKQVTKNKCLLAFCIFLIILGFGGFAFAVLFLFSKELENFTDIMFLPFVFFFIIPVGVISTSFAANRLKNVKTIFEIIEKIKSFDSILLERFFSDNMFSVEIDKIFFVQKLIDTNNLPEYEIVANVLIAKKSLKISEAEARRQYMEYMGIKNGTYSPNSNIASSDIFPELATDILTHCPSCGALVEDEDSNFCQYCGRRLK